MVLTALLALFALYHFVSFGSCTDSLPEAMRQRLSVLSLSSTLLRLSMRRFSSIPFLPLPLLSFSFLSLLLSSVSSFRHFAPISAAFRVMCLCPSSLFFSVPFLVFASRVFPYVYFAAGFVPRSNEQMYVCMKERTSQPNQDQHLIKRWCCLKALKNLLHRVK